MTSTDQEQRVLCDLMVQRQHRCYDITIDRTALTVTSVGKEHNHLMTSQYKKNVDNGALFTVLCDIMVLFVTFLFKTRLWSMCIMYHKFWPNSTLTHLWKDILKINCIVYLAFSNLFDHLHRSYFAGEWFWIEMSDKRQTSCTFKYFKSTKQVKTFLFLLFLS